MGYRKVGYIMKHKKCDKECIGVIKELKSKGLDRPTVITVEYEVDGVKYIINERLIMKKAKTTLLLGFLPIGYETKSLIELKTGEKAIAGTNVKVKYESLNPNNAYLLDNTGKISWD